MIVTVFRSRLMPGLREEYVAQVDRMVELAATIPGYISHKGFFADDGERVTIVEFESEDTQRVWRMHPEHRDAQSARNLLRKPFRAGLSGHPREPLQTRPSGLILPPRRA
jgi:heme-degrading monooxygenase HmoA